MIIAFCACAGLSLRANASNLLSTVYPGATLEKDAQSNFDSVTFYTGPMASKFEAGDGAVVEGRVQSALYVTDEGRSVLEVFRAYQRAAETSLYEEVYQCGMVDVCGGVIPYLFLTAGYSGMPNTQNFQYALYETMTETGAIETVAVLVLARQSSSPELLAPYVFVLSVTSDSVESDLELLTADQIAASIAKRGAASIYGLAFETDAATLLESSAPALDELAAFLSINETISVLLVGHTDSQGSLEYNTELSMRRAASVRTDLISDYGISGDRLSAHGVGYLAPVSNNTSPAGRALNRRVEVVIDE
mgnify:FL=1